MGVHVRQTLYRGDRVDGNGRVEGDLLMVAGVPYIHPREPELALVGHKATLDAVYEVTPESVGQYTGRTDQNGRRIWEGDRVRGRYFMGWEVVARVVFRDGAFGLEWPCGRVLRFEPFTGLCDIAFAVE